MAHFYEDPYPKDTWYPKCSQKVDGIVGRAHHCKFPEVTRAMWAAEVVWECDVCHQRWLAVLSWDPDRKRPGKFFRGGQFPGWSEYDGAVESEGDA